ncbi:hypothetical protein B0H66DRAFT_637663 [Apodospora peruviana]|uniref:Uncharacterized protein n=1 Tax=Apodospora peruviana TaxID=516989 RepID=A0AAE0MCV9_9PEZI|nr:hypothetical protein B0H66DRAFT_637663 [Apodospora peruviana]
MFYRYLSTSPPGNIIWVVARLSGMEILVAAKKMGEFNVTVTGESISVDTWLLPSDDIDYIFLDYDQILGRLSRRSPNPANMETEDSARFYSFWNQFIASVIRKLSPEVYLMLDVLGCLVPLRPEEVPDLPGFFFGDTGLRTFTENTRLKLVNDPVKVALEAADSSPIRREELRNAMYPRRDPERVAIQETMDLCEESAGYPSSPASTRRKQRRYGSLRTRSESASGYGRKYPGRWRFITKILLKRRVRPTNLGIGPNVVL